MPLTQVQHMDAAVTEPTSPTIGYTGKSIEERVSVIEGTIANQDRIFDMLHEGQQNLRADIAGLRAEMRDDMDKRFGEMNTRFGEVDKRFAEMNTRFGEVDKRFGEMNTQFSGVDARIAAMDIRLNTKIDSNLKWILGVQIAMWVTIIAAVLL